MVYIYQLKFEIEAAGMNQLQVERSLERVLRHLRPILSNQLGFLHCRAMYSLEPSSRTELILQTLWESWDDVVAHRDSALAEAKVRQEFEPLLTARDVEPCIYEEIR